MQKLHKNASILLWSIFLSLTIWIAFISISTQIGKNLKENTLLKEKISINNLKNNKINTAIETNNFNNIELSKNEVIIFERDNYYNIWLKNNEELLLKLNSNSNMTIKINEWAPISYENITFPNINWVIIDRKTFLSWNNEILIKNLWGYSNIDIMSEDTFQTNYKKYKILEKIWNKTIIKERSNIKLF